jgi:hypothetical protein
MIDCIWCFGSGFALALGVFWMHWWLVIMHGAWTPKALLQQILDGQLIWMVLGHRKLVGTLCENTTKYFRHCKFLFEGSFVHLFLACFYSPHSSGSKFRGN